MKRKGKATLIRITGITDHSMFYEDRNIYIGKCAWAKDLEDIYYDKSLFSAWLCFCSPKLRSWLDSSYEHAIFGFTYELV